MDSLIAAGGGADVNQQGAWDCSPLIYAAIWGHADLAETLLECGADASLIDVRGETALKHAVGEGQKETAAVSGWRPFVLHQRDRCWRLSNH